ncbi:PepSY domain-containing protein [Bacillus sp. 03113]|uniref:PepSY domain-containing protein n=1 Tax=Bacillus sp. 03113 TaxID=2578211 RepID=UPI001142B516|nr:PepSY domain-containing protein [Bacillus sp. 03113]
MKSKSFLLGVTAGVIGGYLAKKYIIDQNGISSDKALELVKEAFKRDGAISGSWIHMKKEFFEKNDVQYEVYKGGISKTANGVIQQYEFIANAQNGEILEKIHITS